MPPAARIASAPLGTTTTRQPSRCSIVSRTLVTIGFLPATRQSIVASLLDAGPAEAGEGEARKVVSIGAGMGGAEYDSASSRCVSGILRGGRGSIADEGDDKVDGAGDCATDTLRRPVAAAQSCGRAGRSGSDMGSETDTLRNLDGSEFRRWWNPPGRPVDPKLGCRTRNRSVPGETESDILMSADSDGSRERVEPANGEEASWPRGRPELVELMDADDGDDGAKPPARTSMLPPRLRAEVLSELTGRPDVGGRSCSSLSLRMTSSLACLSTVKLRKLNVPKSSVSRRMGAVPARSRGVRAVSPKLGGLNGVGGSCCICATAGSCAMAESSPPSSSLNSCSVAPRGSK